MQCRQCGQEIAAKALICYKCGTATVERKIAPPVPVPGSSRLRVIGMVVAAAVVLAALLVAAARAGWLPW